MPPDGSYDISPFTPPSLTLVTYDKQVMRLRAMLDGLRRMRSDCVPKKDRQPR